jgi:hypothetical protein
MQYDGTECEVWFVCYMCLVENTSPSSPQRRAVLAASDLRQRTWSLTLRQSEVARILRLSLTLGGSHSIAASLLGLDAERRAPRSAPWFSLARERELKAN